MKRSIRSCAARPSPDWKAESSLQARKDGRARLWVGQGGKAHRLDLPE
jgi:hypothetical protein